MKRIVWCVAVMMLLLCVGAWALAEEEVYSDGDYEYEYVLLEDGSAKITKFNGYGDSKTIPEELDGHPVSAIGASAFAPYAQLETVEIPDSVTDIEGNPFTDCNNLQTIEVSADHPTLAGDGRGAL